MPTLDSIIGGESGIIPIVRPNVAIVNRGEALEVECISDLPTQWYHDGVPIAIVKDATQMECISSFCTYQINNQVLRLKLTATPEYTGTYSCIYSTKENYAKFYDTFQLKIFSWLKIGYIQIARGNMGMFDLVGEHVYHTFSFYIIGG